MEEILEIVLGKDNENAFQGEGYSDNDEPIRIYLREDAVEAIKKIELLEQDVESLSPDILKGFYEFRMKFVKRIKNKYVIGSKITVFFSSYVHCT